MTEIEREKISQALASVGFLREHLISLHCSDNILLQEIAYDLLERTAPVQRVLSRLEAGK